MIEFTDLLAFAISTSGLTISLLGLYLILKFPYIDNIRKRFFLILFSLLISYNCLDLFSHIYCLYSDTRYFNLYKLTEFLKPCFISVLMPLLMAYLLMLCHEPLKCTLFYIALGLWLVYITVLVIAQFGKSIYYLTPDGDYHNGPFSFLLLLPQILLLLVIFLALFKRKSKMHPKTYISFLLNYLLPVSLLTVLSSSLGAIILFVFSINEAAKTVVDQRAEIAEQEFLAKSIQIPQHFIYNTLTNIYYLCAIDTKKAQEVVENFSTYLKKNFSSLDKNYSIPFSDELEHTKAYLEVVKARYDDLLFVDYAIQNSAFMLPPLTLEPIVENAVKHALDPELGPLHIWIRTQKENGKNVIFVENDGKDFKFDENAGSGSSGSSLGDSDTHVGLRNIRSRLETVCGGKVFIDERSEGGTIVTIEIPDIE